MLLAAVLVHDDYPSVSHRTLYWDQLKTRNTLRSLPAKSILNWNWVLWLCQEPVPVATDSIRFLKMSSEMKWKLFSSSFFFGFLVVSGISSKSALYYLSSPLFLSPSFTASACVSIYSCRPRTHPSLSLSILRFPYVISSFLILIPLLPTLSHSHLSHLHVVALNSLLTFFAKAPFFLNIMLLVAIIS